EEMATPSTGGVPLDEWRKDVPPGWKPGVENYPLKTYFAKLKLWYRCSEVPDEVIGPLIAGRLQGRAQRIALELKLVRPDGSFDYGDAALVRLSVDEVIDPNDGVTVLQAHIPSGVQALCNALRDAFGDTDEAQTTKALELFFEHKRPHGQELQEFAAEWDLRYEDARSKAGLDMNAVAKSYLWLKQSGLSQKHQDDLRLQVHGDLSRFNEIRGLAVRLSHRVDKAGNTGDVFYEEDHHSHWEPDENYWNDSWWSDDSWSYVEDPEADTTWYGEEEYYEASEWTLTASKAQAAAEEKGKEKALSARAATSVEASGTMSWMPRYYADYDENDFYYNDTNQLRHARQGLSLGDSPRKQNTSDSAKFFNINKEPFTKSDYFEDLLRLERTPKAAQDTATSSEEQPAQMPKKNIDFFFRKAEDYCDDGPTERHETYHEHNGEKEVYHTVGGTRRRGLVIDPGAANGLVGSETLRDLLEHVICEAPQWTSKKSEVTGISGEADSTLGEIKVALPDVNGLESANYRADVIGGNASMCPALVGNPSLVNMRAIIAANWFENKDGLLVIPGEGDRLQMIRLLFTDSKHYLLPLDNQGDNSTDAADEDKMRTFVSTAYEESTKKWSDVRSWFTWTTTTKPKRSLRDSSSPVAHADKKVFFDETPLPTATATTPVNTTEDIGKCSDIVSIHETPLPTATTTPDDTTEDIGVDNFIMSCTTSHPGSPCNTSCTTSHPGGLSTATESGEKVFDDELKFELPSMYPGDATLPDLPPSQQKYLREHQMSVKEEFYNKTGRNVVSPDNYYQWRGTKSARHRPHFWEICSGSGKLTYTALLAGLIVAFPVDYRYGWNIADPEHQRMLLEEQERSTPNVIFFSPPDSFGCYSRSDEDGRRKAQADQQSVANFARTIATKQLESGRGFVLQSLWNSSWWTSSSLSGLDSQLDGFRPRQRADLCAYGAINDKNKPVQQMIGMQANMSLRSSSRRCRGHAQGHVPGRNEKTRKYPTQLCKAIVKDVKKFAAKDQDARFIGYKCKKCAMGRNAPPGTEHTMIPRECRHASSLPTPVTSSTPSSSSNQPPPATQAPVRTAVTTPIDELIEQFKQSALKQTNLDMVKVQMPEDVTMTAVDTLILKKLLLQLVEDSVNIISEQKIKQYHWSQDPLHLAVLRKLFSKLMTVKGVCCSLHSETLPLPMPFLRTESAPLRLIIRGEVKAWTIKPIEDLRTYTDSQLKAKSYNEDWVIAIFGAAPKDKDYWDINRERGVATRHHLQPRTAMFTPREDEGPVPIDDLRPSRVTVATPFDKPGPKVIIRDEWTSRDSSRAALEQGRWTGTTEFQIKIDEDDEPPPADPVVREAAMHEDNLDRADDEAAQAPEDGSPVDPPRRTNFDFRRVLVRLPRLARNDTEQAKRLILGLHERFWHSGTSDLQSLLSRAGMPAEVIQMVPEVVAGCSICRRFARLKSRPVVKAGHPAFFNEEVQADYFQLWNQWFLILIDACTRYKMVTSVTGRDLPTALKAILQNWIRFFGPMKRIVSDQESCIMSHEAAVEFERLNIRREPAGTSRGKSQGQHTTTGIVEKHTDLVKICMLKIKAEAERQGIDVSVEDIAAEASFAQNASINLGGYTPHMMVMGTLPMPYYDMDAPGIQAFTGSDQTNPTAYEKALRLRQLAITAAAQSIAENRIARAGHTRPQRLPTEDMQPGVTEIEFHREDADGYGWRGPGLLLKLQDNGSAIVEYQGRPYLIPMRNLRIFRGTYYNDFHGNVQERKCQELDSWLALRRLMESTEACVPFRIDTYGYVKDNRGTWKVLPKSMNDAQRNGILDDIVLAARFLTTKECHGIKVGVGLKKMLTPAGTTGTLIAWRKNTIRMTIVDNPSGSNMSTVSFRVAGKEEMCYLYFYSYAQNFAEAPSNTWLPKGVPHEESPIVPQTPQVPQATAPMEENDDSHETMDIDNNDNKRDGPESRTVVMAPETKKQRVSYIMPPSAHMNETFLTMHRKQHIVNIEAPHELQSYASEAPLDSGNPTAIFHMRSPGWCADLNVGNIFRVDSATDNIEEHQVYDIWPQVDEADGKEVAQFVNENAFKAVRRDTLGKDCAIIDAIWVRKWKKAVNGRIVKSRLCVRGCHDPWKHELSSRSSTATRLSQRLILTSASNNAKKSLESWDIAGAFLKGLTYQELWKALKELGMQCVERLIAIVPPKNVWRHLKRLSKEFNIPDEDIHDFVLLCLKPVYGLSEAPLAWQLYLHKYLKQIGASQSHFDECYWWWPSPTHGQWPLSSISTHVDDLAVEGMQKWLDEIFEKMMQKFGKLTRQRLPFMHCGCRYSRIPDGYKVDQMEYVEMLKPVKIPDGATDDRALSAAETTLLRSAIGALMWTGLTRPDLLAELSTLQGVMNKANVRHLKDANDLVAKAKRDKEAAIYYRNLGTNSYRIVCIHDASAATSTKNYAQEGVIVVLMADHFLTDENHVVVDDDTARHYLSGQAQLLHCQSNKAKRVSYSTSHGETLAAINGLECATLVSTRLAEATYSSQRPTLQQLLAIQERGCHHFPVDMHTDARDFWELSTGSRSLPQDKSQRLYILAHREARASGRIRWVILTPTECMTADALTKVMTSPVLMEWLTTGSIKFWNTGHPLEMKRLPPTDNLNEQDLIDGDKSLEKKKAWFLNVPMFMFSKKLFGVVMMSTMIHGVASQPAEAPPTYTVDMHDLILVVYNILVFNVYEHFVTANDLFAYGYDTYGYILNSTP
ncbi:RE2, partial [Symbiodinium microadriaticum]